MTRQNTGGMMLIRFFLERSCITVGLHQAEVYSEYTLSRPSFIAAENTPAEAQAKAIQWVAKIDPTVLSATGVYLKMGKACIWLIDAETGEILYDSETIQEG
jgi:hypothetical protein